MKLPSFVEATYGASMLEWVRQTYEGRLNFKGATSTVEDVTGYSYCTIGSRMRRAVIAGERHASSSCKSTIHPDWLGPSDGFPMRETPIGPCGVAACCRADNARRFGS